MGTVYDVAAPSEPEFRNPNRTALRVSVLTAVLLLLLAVLALAVNGGWFHTISTSNREAACLLVFMFGAILAAAMAIAALCLLPAARAADRAMEQFRAGRTLADWRFPAQEWQHYLDITQTNANEKLQYNLLWLPTVATAVGLLVALTAARDGWSRAIGFVAVAGCGAALFWLTWHLADRAVARKMALMRRNPRVMFGPGAAYCGGTLHAWHSGMMALWGAQLLPGTPAMLELTIGASRTVEGANAALGVLGLLSVLFGGNTVAVQSNERTRTLLPVPAGREGEAAEIAQALLREEAARHG